MYQLLRHIAPLLLAAVTLLLTACKDYDDIIMITEPAPDDILNRFNAQGEAYITVGINALGEGANQATRAEGTYVSGTNPNETKMENATIILFGCPRDTEFSQGIGAIPTTRDDLALLKFKFATRVVESEFINDDSDPFGDISSNYRKVITVKDSLIHSGDRLFAFALVNHGTEILDKGMRMKVTATNSGNITIDGDYTFKDFCDIKINSGNRNGSWAMTMSNAPMTTTNDGTGLIQYMPEVHWYDFYPTAEEALSRPAFNVYVERMFAKITLTDKTTSDQLKNNPKVRFQASGTEWVTDQRNNYCYNVRHVSTTYLGYQADGTSVRRFVEEKPSAPGLYRILWAEDVNYNYTKTANETANSTASNEDEFKTDILQRGPSLSNYLNFDYTIRKDGDNDNVAIRNVGYEFENTMNENGLIQGRSTRIAIRVPFIVGKDSEDKDLVESFYTLSTTAADDEIYLTDTTKVASGKEVNPKSDKVKSKIIQYLASKQAYKDWKASSSVRNLADDEIITIELVHGYTQSTENFLPRNDGESDTEYQARCDLEGSNYPGIRIGVPPFGEAWAKVDVNDNKVTNTTDQASFRALKLCQVLQDEMIINFYYKGLAYYKVVIPHFIQSGLNKEVATPGIVTDNTNAYDQCYPTLKGGKSRAENYLGRFGIVRNTWYDLLLEGIRHIGSSVYDCYGFKEYDDPDDDTEDYLLLKVNINRWAEREHHETL